MSNLKTVIVVLLFAIIGVFGFLALLSFIIQPQFGPDSGYGPGGVVEADAGKEAGGR